MTNLNFSVLMSVYKNDRPDWLRTAVESVSVNQTRKPNEIIIVVDGQVGDDLSNELIQLQNEIPVIHIEWCSENRGLGIALQHGLLIAKNDLVARMDSDDISDQDRFKLQIEAFEKDCSLSLVGGQMSEFVDSPTNIVGNRHCPIDNNEIYLYMKSRCALNHVTVMFKKSEVMKAGNYQPWHYNEDYFLWIRMMLGGCKFANLPDTLVNVRVGKEMYARRGGWKYFKSEEGLQRYMLKNKVISLPRYIYNTCGRFVIQVIMPNSLRGFVFQKLFRK